MVVSYESFRVQTLSKYYKEDLVNVLREFFTMEQLQEVLEIDPINKDNLMDILHRGMKKEDLNVILFNSRNITEEALENFRKPNQRRTPVIVFRDVNLGKSESQEETNTKPACFDKSNIRLEREEFNESETQIGNQDQSFRVDRIFSPHQKNLDESFNAEGIFSLPQENSDKTLRVDRIISQREEFQDQIETQQNHLDESFNAEGILATPQDYQDPIETQEENPDQSFRVDRFISPPEENRDQSFRVEGIFSPPQENPDQSFRVEGIISAVGDNIDGIDLQTKIVENDSVNENLKETFLLSLNKIKNISQTKDKFQERLKGLVRNNVAFFEKHKASYRQSDKNYQFYKDHIVPMAKYHNIPLEPFLARDQSEPLRFDRKSRLLRRQNVNWRVPYTKEKNKNSI